MKPREQIIREKNWAKLAPIIVKRWQLDRLLNKSDVVLDFGCGQGVFTNILSKRFTKCYFIGFDIEKERFISTINY